MAAGSCIGHGRPAHSVERRWEPCLTDTPVVETPLAVGGLGIQRRVILRPGKDDLAFSVAVDSTMDRGELFALMDTMTAVAEREGMKSELREKREALRVAQAQPAEMEKDIERLRAQRMAYLGTREAMHDRSGRRGDFKLNDKQQAELDQFDQQISGAVLAKKNFMRDIP